MKEKLKKEFDVGDFVVLYAPNWGRIVKMELLESDGEIIENEFVYWVKLEGRKYLVDFSWPVNTNPSYPIIKNSTNKK